jgi:NAD(P)-dependent dehydrogenase (short-subunit alcohol dehydrogenase family)
MNLSMKDRVAVVTGGSKGIGFAVARRFAESGAKVAILARGAADLKTAREALARDGLAIKDYACDVSKAAEIAKTHNQIVADFGKIDVLVNNAGTARTSALRDQRRSLAGGFRPEGVCRDPIQPAGLGRDEAAQMGPHHQRAQHLCEGAGRQFRADLGVARSGHGLDQGDGE